jgi:hypothetical protein
LIGRNKERKRERERIKTKREGGQSEERVEQQAVALELPSVKNV